MASPMETPTPLPPCSLVPVGHPCLSSYWRRSLPVDNASARTDSNRTAWMAADAAAIGGQS